MAAQAPTLVPQGALMFVALTEGSDSRVAATKGELDSWIAAVKGQFTFTLDSEGSQPKFESYFSSSKDTTFIIELPTMKLVKKYSPGGGYVQALKDLATLLQAGN